LQAVVTTLVGKQGVEKDQVHLFEHRVAAKFFGCIGKHGKTTEPGVGHHDGNGLLLKQCRQPPGWGFRFHHGR